MLSRDLHVGDSVSEDFEDALGAGMQAVLPDRKDLHPGWRRGRRIRSLAELLRTASQPGTEFTRR